MIELQVQQLRTGHFVSPVGSLGTCGWHPKPWSMARVDMRRKDPLGDFLKMNKQFDVVDISGVTWLS